MTNQNIVIITTGVAVVVLGGMFSFGSLDKQNSADGQDSTDPSATKSVQVELSTAPTPVASQTEPVNNKESNNTMSEEVTELKKEVLQVGTGAVAKPGDTVSVHYTGWLVDGKKFDSSVDRGTPFSFKLGAGQVIAGWDQGVAGMKVGEKVKLTIPASLGYGASGYPPVIPQNATLIFEVELLGVN